MAQDKQAKDAMAKALIPVIVLEFLGVVAGVVAWQITGQPLWLLLAFVGTIPMVLLLTKNSRKR